jgi:hypothetical protein
MLIDRWERFKGYDKWPEVHARIEWERSWGLPWTGGIESPGGNPVSMGGMRTMLKQLRICYRDPHGSTQSRSVWLLFCFTLFLLRPGDSFYIRCSPENPCQLYLREQTKGMVTSVVLLVPLVLLAWLGIR